MSIRIADDCVVLSLFTGCHRLSVAESLPQNIGSTLFSHFARLKLSQKETFKYNLKRTFKKELFSL